MSIPEWVVKEVYPQKDYTLIITLEDGSRKLFDARPLLEKPIYAQLKNPAFFMRAKADGDTVVWSDDIDIAPEYLYDYSVTLDHKEGERD